MTTELEWLWKTYEMMPQLDTSLRVHHDLEFYQVQYGDVKALKRMQVVLRNEQTNPIKSRLFANPLFSKASQPDNVRRVQLEQGEIQKVNS
jgi:CHAD domain-containing protein